MMMEMEPVESGPINSKCNWIGDITRCIVSYYEQLIPDPSNRKTEWHKSTSGILGLLQFLFAGIDILGFISFPILRYFFLLFGLMQFISAILSLVSSVYDSVAFVFGCLCFLIVQTVIRLVATGGFTWIFLYYQEQIPYDIYQLGTSAVQTIFTVIYTFFCWKYYICLKSQDATTQMHEVELIERVVE